MKKYILPTVKVLVALVIAVALTKIAFFPEQKGQDRADIASGLVITARTTTATVGDIVSTVEVKGQIVQDKPVEAKATLSGVVDSLAVVKDAMVTQGEPLLYLKKTEQQTPAARAWWRPACGRRTRWPAPPPGAWTSPPPCAPGPGTPWSWTAATGRWSTSPSTWTRRAWRCW